MGTDDGLGEMTVTDAGRDAIMDIDDRLVEMTVPDACGLMWRNLPGADKSRVASELDVGESTLYQWGECYHDGTPRIQIRAAMVERFCAACGDSLLADVISYRTEKAIAAREEVVSTEYVSAIDVISKVEAPLRETIAALEDGLIDNAETRDIFRVLNNAAEVVGVFKANNARRQDSAQDKF